MGRIEMEPIMDCLFCKIVAGEIPAKLVHQEETLLAFADIHPQAPTHVLVLPRRHLGSLAEAGKQDRELLGRLLEAVAEIASRLGLSGGYRTVINTGADGGQTVEHLHLHLLGGRPMHWPPG